jgi:hypothetical protein
MLTRYSVYCNTENNFFSVWSATIPTVCPSDGSIDINVSQESSQRLSTSSITINDTNSPYTPYMTNVINCDTTLGNITVNLPKCSECLYRLYSIVKTSDLNAVTIVPSNTDTIYGNSGNKNITFESGTLSIVSDGVSNWNYIDTYDIPTLQTVINNSELNTKTTYVTVSNNSNNPGDYKSIYDAFSNGEKSVFVKNGLYTEPNEIIIPNGGKLVGEHNGSVYIIGSIKVDASDGVKENTGTISISNNTNTVTGIGTTFTNLSPQDSILLANNYLDILSIEDDTHLTLDSTYRGKSITNQPYTAQKMYTGITLSDFIISNSTGSGIYLRAVKHSIVKNVSSISSTQANFHFIDCCDSEFSTIVAISSLQQGILCESCIDIHLGTCNVYNNAGSGIAVIGNSNFIIMDKCACTSNSSHGFEIAGTSSDISVLGSLGKNNNNKGLTLDSQVTNCTIRGCTFTDNNGNGVDINGNSNNISMNIVRKNVGQGIAINSNFCNLIGNECIENTLDGVHITGNNANLSSNKTRNNIGDGFNILGSHCTVTGNIVTENSNGVVLPVNANGNTITTNQIVSNNNINLINNGNGNITENNI